MLLMIFFLFITEVSENGSERVRILIENLEKTRESLQNMQGRRFGRT